MDKLTIYLNCEDNAALKSWTKKIYLLEADKRLGLNVFKDLKDAGDGPVDNILNIQPCQNTDRRGQKWTGLWHIDCGDESIFSQRYVNFDTVFLASTSSLVKPDNGQILFQAADPFVHKRHLDIKQDYDYSLCGSMDALVRYDERRRRQEIMAKYFTYYNWGKGYPPHEFVKNYNVGKVQYIQSALSPKGEGMCAQRFFECLAIGPVLTNDCDDLFYLGLEENVDYMCYRNDEEMIKKMEMLLADKELRDRIARSGRQKALTLHSYDQRAVAIINTVKEFINV